MTVVALDAIQVVDRHRRDLGDVESLAASIADVGLLHLPVITTDLRLIAGERRLAALRKLGRSEIRVHQVANLSDAEAYLRAERDENTCRKDMAPSEKVALADALRDLMRAEAKERQREGGARGGRAEGSEKFTEASKPQVRDQLGALVGMSGPTYNRANEVVKATEHEDPDVRAVAEQARDEMDETGKVTPAFDKVAVATGRKTAYDGTAKKRAEQKLSGKTSRTPEAAAARLDVIADLAGQGFSSSQIASQVGLHEQTVRLNARTGGIDIPADRLNGRARRIDSTRVARQTVFAIEGAATGLDLIDYDAIDRGEIADWAISLDESMQELKRFHKRIREMTQ